MEAGLQPRLMCTFSVVIPLKATGHCAEKILHAQWRKMSVDEYQKFGRSEMLRYATPGEILRVASAIGQPMSFLDGNPAF
ncbi:hypothetical protein ACLB1R_35740 [Escherichia coli]